MLQPFTRSGHFPMWIENSEWNVLQYRINQSDARIIAVKAGDSKYRFQYVYTMHVCMCAFLKGNTRFEVSERCLSVKKNFSDTRSWCMSNVRVIRTEKYRVYHYVCKSKIFTLLGNFFSKWTISPRILKFCKGGGFLFN